MMQRVWILRHGEAECDTAYDPDRALTDRGARHARAAGAWLATFPAQPRTLVSPYRRAQQTAAEVLKALPHCTIATVDWLTPESDPHTVIRELARFTDDELLLVSHQPLCSALLGVLIAGDYRAGPPMHTASLAELSVSLMAPGFAVLESLRQAPAYSAVPD